jgi:organic radical activating enzyme
MHRSLWVKDKWMDWNLRHNNPSIHYSIHPISIGMLPPMSTNQQPDAFISEIFSSAQGEGVNIGRRQLFVRFCECHRRCLYCDTNIERTDTVEVERVPGSGTFESIPNPIALDALMDLLTEMNPAEFVHDDLFITGGEPLLYVDFLKEMLPAARARFGLPVHLETAGDKVEEFSSIAQWIDHVLMDIKLPSVTGEAGTWQEHLAFLKEIEASRTSATIKLVMNADTEPEDINEAVKVILGAESLAPVVIQPMTATLQSDRVPTAQQMLGWQSTMALALGRGVRIIPQTHKMMGLL